MPLLFSILEHYNLLSKQPNYTYGLFFFDLCLWSCPEPEQSWAFPKRLGLFQEGLITIYFKINIKPNNSKTERRKGHTGPPGQPRGEELPCRFISCPCGSRGDILGPRGSPAWSRAALQVPLLSHDLVMVWAHPGGSRQRLLLLSCFSRVRHCATP